jgi:protein O-mannosyl-transferase
MTPVNSTTFKKLMRISASEFARRLNADLSTQDKRYAFFLGSGCSVSSGIKTAGGLVADEWLPKLRDMMAPEQADHAVWGKDEFDYDHANPAASYGILMERLFLQREAQQREIERLCDNKFPAFGYSVLAALMEHTKANGTFNVVLTTNFDDLVADALYLFTSIRPLVIHHESLAGYIRPTRTRPLIVKIHGDNHLSPYNTPQETSVLPDKTNVQVRNLLHDRGLIFLGYSGNDESVVKLLEALPDDALPLGVYWCSQTEPECRLSEWLHKRQAVWVESPRFDEFMLLVHAAMNLSLPKPKRFEDVFDKLMETYKVLTGTITRKPATTKAQVALKAAVQKADKSFPDWRAVLLKASRFEKSAPAKAEASYISGIERFPESVEILGSYANFLVDEKRVQEAETYYKRAFEAEPTDADNLGNYANFLTNEKRGQEAGAYYKRALEADPTHVNNIGNYASFLAGEKRAQEAEVYYKLALEADPAHVNNLGNYANFLAGEKRAQEAEVYYKLALEADPAHVNNLGNYALFLAKEKRGQEAETYYERAFEADPTHTRNLGNYALLLKSENRMQEAETYCKYALEADPTDAINLGNYAQLLLARNSIEGLPILDQAQALVSEAPADLLLELAFYELVHRPPLGDTLPLTHLKQLLLKGERSKGWDFAPNVARAQQDGHPFAEWLPKLSAVIADELPLEVLAEWPEWQQADGEGTTGPGMK